MMLPECKGITALFCKKAKEITHFVKKKKPGISLAEMLLALAILGILGGNTNAGFEIGRSLINWKLFIKKEII